MWKSIRVRRIAVVMLLALGLVACLRSTPLPFDVSDLSAIQPQLDKLPEDERALVLGYLHRSNGDVLPAKFADPDSPFTARTFGEAIKLQREFLARQAVQDTAAAARRSALDAAMEPLRDALDVDLVRREILAQAQLFALPAESANVQPVKRATDDHDILVVTYRLRNRSAQAITAAKGSVKLRDAEGKLRTDCWFDQRETLEVGSSVDVRCANTSKPASDEDRAFVAMPVRTLTMYWEPDTINFANGKTLKSGR